MELVIDKDDDGFGSTVFVTSRRDYRQYVNGVPVETRGIEIISPSGTVKMTYKQWKTLLSLGIALGIEEGTDDE